MSDAPMYRQVALLASAQALFQTASVMVMTIGGLAGQRIAADPQLATAPIAAMFLGTAMATFPAAMLMTRFGRRNGFVSGALLGVFGGVVAAIAGPELGRRGADVIEPAFLGSFLILAVLSLVAMAVLLGFRAPPGAKAAASGGGRPLRAIIAQPVYMIALFGAATGYGVMILGMTATPLAMAHHHHDFSDTTRVIQAHVLGMFIPSFFTGALIARFGVWRIMAAGIGLFAAHIAIASSGTSLYSFGAALVLLGIGWNFLYIGGTTLLTGTYTAAERGRAQGFNDLTIFAVSLAASLLSGALLQSLGWQMLNLILVPWLAVAFVAILWLGFRRSVPAPVTSPRGSS